MAVNFKPKQAAYISRMHRALSHGNGWAFLYCFPCEVYYPIGICDLQFN